MWVPYLLVFDMYQQIVLYLHFGKTISPGEEKYQNHVISELAEGVVAIIMKQKAAHIIELLLIFGQIFQFFLMLVIYRLIHL